MDEKHKLLGVTFKELGTMLPHNTGGLRLELFPKWVPFTPAQETCLLQYLLHRCGHDPRQVLQGLDPGPWNLGRHAGLPGAVGDVSSGEALKRALGGMLRHGEDMGCNAGQVLLSMLKENDLGWVSDELRIDPEQRFKKTFGLSLQQSGPSNPAVELACQTDPVLDNGRGVGPEHVEPAIVQAAPAPAPAPAPVAVRSTKEPAGALRCMKARQLVALIYQNKISADEVAQREGKPRERMSAFYKEWLLHRHGLASIASKQASALATSVLCFTVEGSNPQNPPNPRGDRSAARYDKQLRLFGKLVGIGKHPGYDEGDTTLTMDLLRLLFPADKLKGLAEKMGSAKGCFVSLADAEEALPKALLGRGIIGPPSIDEVVKARLGRQTNPTTDGERLTACIASLRQQAEPNTTGMLVLDVDAVLEAAHAVWEVRQAERVAYLGGTFASFDLDNDGVLSFGEFQALIKHFADKYGLPAHVPTVASLYTEAVADTRAKLGALDRPDFTGGVLGVGVAARTAERLQHGHGRQPGEQGWQLFDVKDESQA